MHPDNIGIVTRAWVLWSPPPHPPTRGPTLSQSQAHHAVLASPDYDMNIMKLISGVSSSVQKFILVDLLATNF